MCSASELVGPAVYKLFLVMIHTVEPLLYDHHQNHIGMIV